MAGCPALPRVPPLIRCPCPPSGAPPETRATRARATRARATRARATRLPGNPRTRALPAGTASIGHPRPWFKVPRSKLVRPPLERATGPVVRSDQAHAARAGRPHDDGRGAAWQYRAMGKITGVELLRVAMPLVAPFRTSFGTQDSRDILLVRVVTPEAEGWGECVAMDEPLYSAEYTAAAADVLARFLVRRPWRWTRLTATAVGTALVRFKGHPMAKAALEIAVLDAELRAAGLSPGPLPGRRQQTGSHAGSRWASPTRCPSCSTPWRATWRTATCGSSSRSSRAGMSIRSAPCGSGSETSCCRSTRTPPTAWPTPASSRGPGSVRPAAHRAAAGRRRSARSCRAGRDAAHPGLPG